MYIIITVDFAWRKKHCIVLIRSAHYFKLAVFKNGRFGLRLRISSKFAPSSSAFRIWSNEFRSFRVSVKQGLYANELGESNDYILYIK